jgi:hypothetical protein
MVFDRNRRRRDPSERDGAFVGHAQSADSTDQKMNRRYFLLDARIYLREWGVPFAVAIGLIALGIAGYLYLTGHFKTELSNRSMHYSYSTIERIGVYRPGPKQGFAATEKFVFRIQGQEIEYPAPFHGVPGEPVKVDYTVGASGKVYVWKVDRGEP